MWLRVVEILGLAAVAVGVGAYDWRVGSVVAGVSAVVWANAEERGD